MGDEEYRVIPCKGGCGTGVRTRRRWAWCADCIRARREQQGKRTR